MKNKILSVLLGILVISPLPAFADVIFQNFTTSPLTVQYQLCYDSSPQPVCSSPIITPVIPPALKGLTPYYNVKQTDSWKYVVTLKASTDDGWKYLDSGMGQNCGNLQFYDSGIPHFANFSKTYVNPWMQCQSTDGFAKKSK